jgi:hypothetical protein
VAFEEEGSIAMRQTKCTRKWMIKVFSVFATLVVMGFVLAWVFPGRTWITKAGTSSANRRPYIDIVVRDNTFGCLEDDAAAIQAAIDALNCQPNRVDFTLCQSTNR